MLRDPALELFFQLFAIAALGDGECALISVARRLLRVPFIGVPRAVVRDRHAGRREARAVPAQGPMQADFFRHQADIWQAVAA